MPSRAAECTAETTAETFRLETKRRKLKRGTLRERARAEASREVMSVRDRVDASRREGERHACTRLCACTIEPQRST